MREMPLWSRAKERLSAKTKGKPGPKLGSEEVQKTPLYVESSTSDCAIGPKAGLVTSLEVHGAPIPEENVKSRKSLWDRAYEELRSKKKGLIDALDEILTSEPEIESTTDLSDGSTSERERQMSTLVDRKLKAMNERQWRIKVCGRSVEVREQVDRVVKVVLVAKDFISSVASIDPIHAGLPWAGVCMLLPLVINDTKQRAAAIDGLEYISKLVRRYAEIEHIYLQGEESTIRSDLEAAIIRLYSLVLEYEARAACQFNRNTTIQIARNIVEADSWKDMLQKIEEAEQGCNKFKDIIDAKDQQLRTKLLESILDEQTRKVDGLLKASRSQDEELLAEVKAIRTGQKELFQTKDEMDCLKCLRTTAYENTMLKNQDRVPGTCEWFLRHPRYCEWLDNSGSDLLWVTADPGCGKSVLSKFLIDDYRSWMWKDVSICYFFFKDDSDENKSATHALCAILHQLFIQNHGLLKHAMIEYNRNGNKLPQLFEALWDILIEAATDPNGGGIVCIIDALDECAESSCEQLIRHLADFYSTSNAGIRIKFIITSRPNDFIRRDFFQQFARYDQDPLSLKLMGESEREMEEIAVEINLVIDAKVKEFQKLRFLEEINDNAHVAVQEQLKKTENRTYLWLALIFPELEKMAGYGEDALLEAAKRIPSTVDEAYERILANSRDVNKAKTLLHIVCAASRPLTLAEMNRALSINHNGSAAALIPPQSFPRVVRDMCGLFVNIHHDKLYLIHQTAKEFLVNKNFTQDSTGSVQSSKGPWKHSLAPTDSNYILANICVSYLLFAEFESQPLVIADKMNFEDKVRCICQYTNKHDFLDYSAKYWTAHFRETKVREKAILERALELCNTGSKRFQAWFQASWLAFNRYYSSPQRVTDLLVGAYFGLEEIVKLLLEKGVDVDSKDSKYGQTPLSWAARNGHGAIVKLLLEKGVDFDSKDNDDGRTPLSWAAANGHEAVVKLLLEKGVDVDLTDNKSRTPLLWAAGNGHEAVVKLLLEKGADIELKDSTHGQTSLLRAAATGHEAVVKLLLEKGADVDSKDNNSQTPLLWAAAQGHEAVVKLLLAEKGVDVDTKDSRYGQTLLSRAAANGHEAVVKLLLEKGADGNFKDNNSQTPLLLAAGNGHEAVVKLLLKKGVDVNLKDKYGQTPLSWAVENEHEAVVKLLLEKAVVVDFKTVDC